MRRVLQVSAERLSLRCSWWFDMSAAAGGRKKLLTEKQSEESGRVWARRRGGGGVKVTPSAFVFVSPVRGFSRGDGFGRLLTLWCLGLHGDCVFLWASGFQL